MCCRTKFQYMPHTLISRTIILSISLLLIIVSGTHIKASGIVFSDKTSASSTLQSSCSSAFFFKPDSGGTGGILPLHNFSLSVVLKENTVFLKWLAENEMNTEKFIVQRSTDGAVFTDISTLPPSGPMNVLTSYTGKDDITSFSSLIIYYRVKAQDNRNNYAYSNVVPVRSGKTAEFRCWPNPFSQSLTITYHATTASVIEIRLSDSKGTCVKTTLESAEKGANQLNLSALDQLRPGVYMLYLFDHSSGVKMVQPVLKAY